MNVAVLGGGPIGLATAMLLAREGHEVLVLEKDEQSAPATIDEIWDRWERKGVSQFRQAHYMHARFRHTVDAEFPDVRDELLSLGGRPFNPIGVMTAHLADPTPREGDDRFESIAARRPIIESAFVRVAENHPGVKVVRGVTVEGPVADGTHVTGVRTKDGETFPADLVVDAMGRRSQIVDWIEGIGGRAPLEEATDTGFAYYTRCYQGDLPEYRSGIGTMLESFMVLTVPSDNETWTIAFIAMAGDKLLKNVRTNEAWERVLRAVPQVAHWIDATPVCDVIPMAGAMDRYRRFVLDGVPVVTGLVAVGDSWACTNPTAGRGISLGLAQAVALRDALREHPDDPTAMALALDATTEEKLTPWYRQQVERDQRRSAEVQAVIDGRTLPPLDDPMAKMQRAFMAGAGQDPELARAFFEMMSILALPHEIMARPGMFEKVASYADAELPRPGGPTRADLAALLT
jgi:2-polyprenyl-6-methoxyphenol hydroxylase-like FAD-dependent oxidoreductase